MIDDALKPITEGLYEYFKKGWLSYVIMGLIGLLIYIMFFGIPNL